MAGERLELLLEPLLGEVDLTFAEVLAAVLAAFNAEFDANFDTSSLRDDERERLREYLIRSQSESGASPPRITT